MINLGSIAGLTGLPNIGPYNASKAAVDALTRTLAVELGPVGVLCNSVAPGTVGTEMVEGLMAANPALRERLVAKSPLGRIGTVGEAAWPIVFLLTDAASFITGHTLLVDGVRLAAARAARCGWSSAGPAPRAAWWRRSPRTRTSRSPGRGRAPRIGLGAGRRPCPTRTGSSRRPTTGA